MNCEIVRMGCEMSLQPISKDTDPSASLNDEALMVSSLDELVTFLDERISARLKCVFIFGGPGSCKGEIICELISREHKEWGMIYVDIQSLIFKNIMHRIQTLAPGNDEELEATARTISDPGGEKPHNILIHSEKTGISRSVISENTFDSESKPSSSQESVCLKIPEKYCAAANNIITSSWVSKLLLEEIKSILQAEAEDDVLKNDDVIKRTFIINLIPDRIYQLRNCLYFRQKLNLHNFEWPYIAIKIIRHEDKKKYADHTIDTSLYDEVSNRFIAYFKDMRKLIEISMVSSSNEKNLVFVPKSKSDNTGFNCGRIRISRQKDAIKIRNIQHLVQLIQSRKSQTTILDINISGMDEIFAISEKNDLSHLTDSKPASCTLVFLTDGVIYCGSLSFIIDSSETNMEAVGKFVRCCKKHCKTN